MVQLLAADGVTVTGPWRPNSCIDAPEYVGHWDGVARSWAGVTDSVTVPPPALKTVACSSGAESSATAPAAGKTITPRHTATPKANRRPGRAPERRWSGFGGVGT